MSNFEPVLGPYQSVAIDGTGRYTTSLAPGLYSIEAEGSPVHVNLQTNNSTPATTSMHRIASGSGRYVKVPADGSTYYIALIRSGSGSGTLHVNKVGG